MGRALGVVAAVLSDLARPGCRLGHRPPRGGLLREALRVLPDVLRLVRHLAADKTLPRGVRIRLGLLLAYLAIPIDLIPDFIPVLGYADDAIIVTASFAALSAMRHRRGPCALAGTDDGFAAIARLTGLNDDRILLTALAASAAAFGLAVLSSVAGFGGGVLLLPVFTVLFGLRAAVPMLTLTQFPATVPSLAQPPRAALADDRLVRHRRHTLFHCRGLLLAHAPLIPLKRVLGAFLIGVVIGRRLQRQPRPPTDPAFIAVGAASGLGSALLGSVGPLTAPFFLAAGLTRATYIGTEAASALTMTSPKSPPTAPETAHQPRTTLRRRLTPAPCSEPWSASASSAASATASSSCSSNSAYSPRACCSSSASEPHRVDL